MALIRGNQGLCPCPVCLVSSKKLIKLEEHSVLRTQKATLELLAAVKERNKTQGEELLKQYGLRNLQVSEDTLIHKDHTHSTATEHLLENQVQ